MDFERGTHDVLQRLVQKRDFLRDNNPAHEEIRPVLIVLSGLMRGVNAAGQVVSLVKNGFSQTFEAAVGVSTGAGPVGYLSTEDVERCISIYWNECITSKFLCGRRAILGKPMMDIDFLSNVFRGNTERKVRLNEEAMRNSRTQFFAAATHEPSGDGVLLDMKTTQPDAIEAMRASMAMPGISHGNVEIGGERYLDGAGAFPFPVQEMVRRFDPTDILVLANCPRDEKASDIESAIMPTFLSSLSEAAQKVFASRSRRFQEELAYVRNQSRFNFGIAWAPTDIGPFERNPQKLEFAARRAEQGFSNLLSQSTLQHA